MEWTGATFTAFLSPGFTLGLYFSTSPNTEGRETLNQLIFYNVQGFKSVLTRTVQAQGKVF
jgi:hypothetical protein